MLPAYSGWQSRDAHLNCDPAEQRNAGKLAGEQAAHDTKRNFARKRFAPRDAGKINARIRKGKYRDDQKCDPWRKSVLDALQWALYGNSRTFHRMSDGRHPLIAERIVGRVLVPAVCAKRRL